MTPLLDERGMPIETHRGILMESGFTQTEEYKIQSVADLFTNDKYGFSVDVDGVLIELLTVQGAMGVNISGLELVLAVAESGGVGTFSSTMNPTDELLRMAMMDLDGLPIYNNNLAGTSGYDENMDFAIYQAGVNGIVPAAALPRSAVKMLKGQPNSNPDLDIVPIYSNLEKLIKLLHKLKDIDKKRGIKRKATHENMGAGGHNGEGQDYEGALDAASIAQREGFNFADYHLNFAGRIRRGIDFIRALDHGYAMCQIGTNLLPAKETNINQPYKDRVAFAGPNAVIPYASVCGLTGNVLKDTELVRRLLAGESIPKKPCKDDPHAGCFANCNKIKYAKEIIREWMTMDADQLRQKGIYSEREMFDYPDSADHCIKLSLLANNKGYKGNYPALEFCGVDPHLAELGEWFEGRQASAREILGKLMIEVYDTLMGEEFKDLRSKTNLGDNARFKQKHIDYLKNQFSRYETFGKRSHLTAKVLNPRNIRQVDYRAL